VEKAGLFNRESNGYTFYCGVATRKEAILFTIFSRFDSETGNNA